jgi:hypothetical protein
MVDFAMDIYKKVNPGQPVPTEMSSKRDEVMATMQTLRDEARPRRRAASQRHCPLLAYSARQPWPASLCIALFPRPREPFLPGYSTPTLPLPPPASPPSSSASSRRRRPRC